MPKDSENPVELMLAIYEDTALQNAAGYRRLTASVEVHRDIVNRLLDGDEARRFIAAAQAKDLDIVEAQLPSFARMCGADS